ncbi:MAG: hypothetical protein ACKN9V_09105 [Pseudomonadota bacterium]
MKKLSIQSLILLSMIACSSGFSIGWKLHLGASVSNLEQRFKAPTGFASKVSEVQGLLGVSKTFRLSRRLGLTPEAFILLPWRRGMDGTTLTFTQHLGLLIDIQVSKPIALSLGNGLLWEMYCSKGEAVPLGNGTGSSTFYTPSRWTQVVLPTALISIEWKFSKKVGFQIGAVISEYLDSNKRRFRGIGKLVIDL